MHNLPIQAMPALILMMLLAVAFPLLLGLVFSAATQGLERRALRRLTPEPEPGPAAGVLLVLAAIMALAVVGDYVLHLVGVRRVPAAVSWLGATVVAFSWALHSIPGHSRVLKYGLFVGGAVVVRGIHQTHKVHIDGFWIAFAMVHLVLLLAGLFVALRAIRPDAPLAVNDASSARTVRWHRVVTWFQGPDPLSALAWAPLVLIGLGAPYLLVRFAIKHRMARTPILYLRSFHLPEAAQVFGQVVCPAAYRSAPISGLVHRTQSNTALQRAVPFLWRTNFRTVADDAWRAFIEREVPRALGVIIDVSGWSESLQWELDVARRWHADDRILILHSADVAGSDSHTGPSVAYRLPGAAADGAREQIQAWVGHLLAPFTREARPAFPVRAPRWQVPMMAMLYVVIGAPMALSAWAFHHLMSGYEQRLARFEVRAAEAQARRRRAEYEAEYGAYRDKQEAARAGLPAVRGAARPHKPSCAPGDPLCGDL